MKIIFWSNLHGQGCTTANMLAVALYTAVRYEKKTMITQTHYNFNNLEIPLMGKVAEKDFYRDIGLDAIMRCVKSVPLTEEVFHNCSVSLLNEQLILLPGTKQQNREVFEEDTTKMIVKILKDTGRYFEAVFVDTNSGNGAVTAKALQEADLVVVNLRQNLTMIDGFFEERYLPEGKEVFYLFGAYDKDSRYSIENIRRKYKKINKKNSGIIPYNIEYADAFSGGRAINFIKNNMESGKENPNYMFLKSVGDAAAKILDCAGMS